MKQLNLAVMLDLNILENEPARIDPTFISFTNASRRNCPIPDYAKIVGIGRHLETAAYFLGNPLL